MANTAIIDLAKPAGTDHALISVINSNMDKIDAEAGRQRGNFAGTYSTTSGYAVGDYCIYQGNLYRCTTAIGSSGENWTAAHWTSVKVGTELKGLSDQIANLSSWTDITSSCTWLNTITVKSCHYNALLKMLMINVQIPSGTVNTTSVVTLPSGYTFGSTAIIETIGYDNTTTQRIQYGVSSNGKSLVLYTSSGNATGIGAQIYRQFRYT